MVPPIAPFFPQNIGPFEPGRPPIHDLPLQEPNFDPPISPTDLFRGVLKGGIKRATKEIDSKSIRDIEKRVREGATSFRLDTFNQLKRVAEGMRENVQRALQRGNANRARDVADKSKGLVDRLDRFKPLTPEARQQLKDVIDEPLE